MSNIPLVQNVISDKYKFQAFIVAWLCVIAVSGYAVISATDYFFSNYSDFHHMKSKVVKVGDSYYVETSGPGGAIPKKIKCLRIQAKNGAVFYLKKSYSDWEQIQKEIKNNLDIEIEFFYIPHASHGTGTLKAIKIDDNFIYDKITDKSDSIIGLVFFSIVLLAATLVMVYYIRRRREFTRQKSS